MLNNLPHAEEAVITNLLHSKYALKQSMVMLEPQDFTHPYFRNIYILANDLFTKGIEVNLITLVEKAKKTKKLKSIGGFDFLKELNDGYVSDANADSYIKAVKTLTKEKMFKSLLQTSLDKLNSGVQDSQDILQETEKAFLELSTLLVEGSFQRADEFSVEVLKKMLTLRSKPNKHNLTGLRTGYKEIDKLTGGLQNSDLIVLAARPSMGKTALALNMLANIAVLNKKPTALFSLEMPTNQITHRLISIISKVPAHKLKSPSLLSKEEFLETQGAIELISQMPIYIYDKAGTNIEDLMAQARRLYADVDGDLSCIFIDYMSLIWVGNKDIQKQNQNAKVTYISSLLKQLARDLNIPVVVLSQLNRQAEMRENKMPMLSDLRDSGSIEQDADIVILLYREDFYVERESKKKGEAFLPNNDATLIFAKHRNGAVGIKHLTFIPELNRFENKKW